VVRPLRAITPEARCVSLPSGFAWHFPLANVRMNWVNITETLVPRSAAKRFACLMTPVPTFNVNLAMVSLHKRNRWGWRCPTGRGVLKTLRT
jgi:hypothetical protein